MRANDQTSDNLSVDAGREHVRSAVRGVQLATAHPAPEAWPAAGARSTDTLVLADGSRLRLRAIGRGDRDALAGLFARMSPASRYRRYLSPKTDLAPRELSFLTDIDHVSHEAIAAVDQRDGSIVGVARYVEEQGQAGVAEIAVEVADERQNMGVGTALTEVVVVRARASGVSILTARTLWDNWPARSLLRRLRFRPRKSRGNEIELQLVL